jgi:hypothetical protein
MNRWILAVAVLFGGAVVVAHADYVIIKINLATAKDKEKEANPQGNLGQGPLVPGAPGNRGPGVPGMPGGKGMGMQGGMGASGGAPGGRGPGMPGMPPAPGLPGMPGAGGMGMQGGAPRQGGSGIQGGVGIQGGAPGMGQRGGPGIPGMPGMGMGMQGMGMQGMQGMGMMGGRGPAGMQGMGMGMMGGMGGSAFGQTQDEEEDAPPIFVGAIIEVEHSNFHKAKGLTGHANFTHKWGGKTHLPYLSNTHDIVWVHIDRLPTVAKRYEAEKAKIKEDDPNRVSKLIELAQWALEHGLIKHVPEIMAEVNQLDSKNKIAEAFQKVQAAIARRPTQDDPVIAWRERLGEFNVMVSDAGHYTLLFDGTRTNAAHRLQRLEENYQAFYYWWALQGIALPVPDFRLVAVLVNQKEAFEHQLKDIFDNVPTVSDGFFARRDNLAVFSANRLDETFEGFKSIVSNEFFTSFDQDKLLKGEAKTPRNMTYDTVARAETCTLVMKAMEEEAELAAVSHEGTRQLISAAGLLPRNLQAPRWLDVGTASFFETPKGSPWSGTGGGHLPYLARLHLWAKTKSKNLEKTPDATLRAVVTDHYFRELSKDPKKKEGELLRARATSWALVYYLAHKKRDGLRRYFDELSNMPRDLEFDDQTLLDLFGRSFGLMDVTNPSHLDANKVTNLANEWYRFMQDTPIELDELVREVLNAGGKKIQSQPATTKPGGTPPGGGGPGGIQ